MTKKSQLLARVVFKPSGNEKSGVKQELQAKQSEPVFITTAARFVMGLSLVRSIVTTMEGCVEVTRREGKREGNVM